jgi:hypothetical protein
VYIASDVIKENEMNLDWHMKSGCCALGAALALAATAALASQTSVPQTSAQLTVADSTEKMAGAPVSTMPSSYPPLEAGVWRAAAEGPVALRRYIFRTRMIYNYYYPNFIKTE